ncbi:LysE family translocator [Planctobacterium marinum]|uniref:Lysine transporter LysE n=1 Tax=Planctobacterium marinum TaxID=1631968 RepID=A0AA48KQI4_9ALTE|nr:lysine transporter LysE [Planctobacterium marinum]
MDVFNLYWVEFLTIAVAHLVAVASPGPDFAIVLKNSVSFGRRAGIITSIGVGLGILLHVAYSLAGIGLLIKTTPWLFTVFSYAAAAYLIWIGINALRSAPAAPSETEAPVASQLTISDKKAFWTGFLTNGLNPKATLFFLSLFAVIVSVDTPMTIKAVYGVYLTIATGVWFCFLSYVLSSRKVRDFIGSNSHWFDRVMGAILIALAIKLLTS